MPIPTIRSNRSNTKNLVYLRALSIFRPIQEHTYRKKDKYGYNECEVESDWLYFSLGFFIDCLLELVHFINLLISVANVLIAVHGMAISDDNAYDDRKNDLKKAGDDALFSALALFNPVISLLSYLTRSVASLVYLGTGKVIYDKQPNENSGTPEFG